MKLLIITTIAVLGLSQMAIADKLTNRYLPPNHASTSGGNSGFLRGPAYQQQGAAYHGSSGAGNYASAASAPVHHTYNPNPIPIIRSNSNNDGSGNYNFNFETGNGIRRDETGVFQPGHPEGTQTVSGSYSYVGDDGQTYTVKYHADGNGFHAEGDHLPTPPPIPKEIQESLALHHQGGGGGGSGSYQGGGYNGLGAYGGGQGGFGGHAAASQQQPNSQYLPPQRQRGGYSYGVGQY